MNWFKKKQKEIKLKMTPIDYSIVENWGTVKPSEEYMQILFEHIYNQYNKPRLYKVDEFGNEVKEEKEKQEEPKEIKTVNVSKETEQFIL
ncbi:MAG: hypothetical protein PHN88_09140 [Ignavibacteria bacterium]|nr:hypothetical protein [Ignavibacteria bacterium]